MIAPMPEYVIRLEAEVQELRDELAAIRKATRLVDPAGLPAITQAQAGILQTILDLRAATGCTPSVRELQLAHGFKSPHGANSHLQALEAKGWLWRAPDKRRTARSLLPTVIAVPADKIVPGQPRRAIA